MIVELLWARCPGARIFQELGARYGIEKPRFEPKEEELCYLCGLCVRICDEMVGARAISFVNRGVDRAVGTPFFKVSEACIACGACEFVCPTGAIKVTDVTDKEPRPLLLDFDMGLRGRGNIYIPFPQAVPNIPVIDREHCLHFQADACGVCEVFCPPGAIDFAQEDEFVDVDVGAIVVATGFDPFDATNKPEFGYGRYPNVISGLEFERLASASGPTKGKIQLNGTVPQEIVFIHCVGSRDKLEGEEYCSRICCMYTAKQAHLAHDKIPGAKITVFYMDVRAFGKGFEEFYDRVRAEGITYRRGNPSEIYKRAGKLIVRAEDTLLSKTVEVPADLVVLATGVQPRADADQVAEMLGLEFSADGFYAELHPELRPVSTKNKGIYLAGTCQAPKDIPDTVAQAKAAAAEVIVELSRLRRKRQAFSADRNDENTLSSRQGSLDDKAGA
jgi:heterodisulfide reductase subunit A